MNLKNWPYWIKGGVIYSLIVLPIMVISFFELIILTKFFSDVIFIPVMLFWLITDLLPFCPMVDGMCDIEISLSMAVSTFIIGALLGAIYEKIKNGNKKAAVGI
jgi:hypothetical protein